MPLYEEKLICPLAIHFTQDHIRPAFQDGHEVECTVREITARPGEGDYDVILEAPFPNIEIIRWYQKDVGGRRDPCISHWFTLDNRRLYCLQRAAAALWPRRAACVVEVLYAAPEAVWRKNTSVTMGSSVGIGHSPKALVRMWCWRNAVSQHHAAESAAADTKGQEDLAAYALIDADEGRGSIEELLSAPAPPSMLDLYLQGAAAAPLEPTPRKESPGAGSEVATTSPSTPRSATGSNSLRDPWETASIEAAPVSGLDTILAGRWQGEQGEVYNIRVVGPGRWVCEYTDSKWKWQEQALRHDDQADAVWWCSSEYLDVSNLWAQPDCIKWFGKKDTAGRKPRYTWHKVQSTTASQAHERGRRARVPPHVRGQHDRSSGRGHHAAKRPQS